MKSWSRIRLEWVAGVLFQLFMPLFLFYRIADGFPILCGENGDRWSVKAQNDATRLAVLASMCRFALSPTIHRTFCGSNW
jgi:hypothetical protein